MKSKVSNEYVDFSNTQIAFAHKSDRELLQSARLFRLMNSKWLVDFGSWLGVWAVRLRLPFVRTLVRRTIFAQFVGGETLEECHDNIVRLWENNTLTVLDYGAEGRSEEHDLDEARDQFIKAVRFAASEQSVPVVGIKLSALSRNSDLEDWQTNTLIEDARGLFDKAVNRVEEICRIGHSLGVRIFIDAEESWMQDTIDWVVNHMMEKYNRKEAIVYNTFQMYRQDRYDFLLESHATALNSGYLLGAKIVRGAYMEKERLRAEEMGYESPIHTTKRETDVDFDKAISYCVSHYASIASCAATHNMQSCLHMVKLIGEGDLPRNHPHLNFCQLYGMSDHITFNLAAKGYNVAKYVVYGQVREIVPYLVRRARENTAVKGEFSREYRLIDQERRRRKC